MSLMRMAAAMFLLAAVLTFATGNTALGASNVALAVVFFGVGSRQVGDSD